MQTGLPVVQETTPVKHGLLFGWHDDPVEQATQLPALQTWFAPQGVPSGTLDRPVQVERPVEQEVVPVLHGLPLGLHDAPAVHMAHWPLAQTWLVPHAVPSAAVPPVSVQTMPPSTHETVPR